MAGKGQRQYLFQLMNQGKYVAIDLGVQKLIATYISNFATQVKQYRRDRVFNP
jgi:transposase